MMMDLLKSLQSCLFSYLMVSNFFMVGLVSLDLVWQFHRQFKISILEIICDTFATKLLVIGPSWVEM